MLAHNGVALHGRCMPNVQSRPNKDVIGMIHTRGCAEGRVVIGKGKRSRRPTDTVYFARQDDHLINVND